MPYSKECPHGCWLSDMAPVWYHKSPGFKPTAESPYPVQWPDLGQYQQLCESVLLLCLKKKRKRNLESVDGAHFHSYLTFLHGVLSQLEFHQIHQSQCITLV
jgi:hypothetical protein